MDKKIIKKEGVLTTSAKGGTASKNAIGWKVSVPGEWAAEIGCTREDKAIIKELHKEDGETYIKIYKKHD